MFVLGYNGPFGAKGGRRPHSGELKCKKVLNGIMGVVGGAEMPVSYLPALEGEKVRARLK